MAIITTMKEITFSVGGPEVEEFYRRAQSVFFGKDFLIPSERVVEYHNQINMILEDFLKCMTPDEEIENTKILNFCISLLSFSDSVIKEKMGYDLNRMAAKSLVFISEDRLLVKY